MAVHAVLCWTWSETEMVGFLCEGSKVNDKTQASTFQMTK